MNNYRAFDNCLRFYGNRYRVEKGDDGIYAILCPAGDIEPYSLDLKWHCCFQRFKNGYGLNALLRKLPGYCTVTQQGAADLVFKFPADRLEEIAGIVRAYRRRQISESERARLRQIGKTTVFKKYGTGDGDKTPKSGVSPSGGIIRYTGRTIA